MVLGRRRTPSGDQIDFKANYQLAEVRRTETLNADKPRWTLTDGYRLQVMNSRDAFPWRDGRDTTEGFTFGGSATF